MYIILVTVVYVCVASALLFRNAWLIRDLDAARKELAEIHGPATSETWWEWDGKEGKTGYIRLFRRLKDFKTRIVIIKPNGARVVIDLRNKTKPRKVPVKRSK